MPCLCLPCLRLLLFALAFAIPAQRLARPALSRRQPGQARPSATSGRSGRQVGRQVGLPARRLPARPSACGLSCCSFQACTRASFVRLASASQAIICTEASLLAPPCFVMLACHAAPCRLCRNSSLLPFRFLAPDSQYQCLCRLLARFCQLPSSSACPPCRLLCLRQPVGFAVVVVARLACLARASQPASALLASLCASCLPDACPADQLAFQLCRLSEPCLLALPALPCLACLALLACMPASSQPSQADNSLVSLVVRH